VFSVDKAKVHRRKKKFSATFKTAGFARRIDSPGDGERSRSKQQSPKKTFTKTTTKSFKVC